MSTVPPASTKAAPDRAIFERASSVVFASCSPRSTKSRFKVSKSDASTFERDVRVTKRTKSSHSEAIDMGASGRFDNVSPAYRKLSCKPIMVDADESLMCSVSALIAAHDGPPFGSPSK